MTPLSIDIEGIRSFTTARTIDFGGLELFAIIGDTGSGKSSILEAMVYALFNGATWDGKNVKELMSTSATRMKVALCFELAGLKYKITRITPRIGVASHLLECEGHPEERRDGERAIASRLKELLGVDREQFIKTIILPQGEFAALLTLDPGRRATLLADVLGLGVIDVMARRLDTVRTRASGLWDKLKGRRAVYPDDPAVVLASADELARELEREDTSLRQTFLEIDLEESSLAATRSRAERRAALRETIASVTPEVEGLRSLRAIHDELEREVEHVERRLREAKLRVADAVEALDDGKKKGIDPAAVGNAQRTLERLKIEVRESTREASELEAAKTEVRLAESTGEERAKAAIATNAIAEEARIEEAATKIDAQSASEALSAAEKVWTTLCAARESHAVALKAQSQAGETSSALTTICTNARLSLEENERALSQARESLGEAERRNSAAHAADGLLSGDPCPICQRPLPEDFERPLASDLDLAKRNVEATEARHRETATAYARAEAQATSARADVEKAKAEVQRLQHARDEALSQASLLSIDLTKESGGALEGARERARSAAAKHAKATAAREEADRRCLLADAQLDSLRERLKEQKAQLGLQEARIIRRDREIVLLRAQFPNAYLPTGDSLSEASLANAAALLETATKTAESLAAAHVAALREERDVGDNARQLDQRRRNEVERPMAERKRLLLSASDALLGSGYVMPSQELADGNEFQSLVSWANALVAACDDVAQHLAGEESKDAAVAATANSRIAICLSRCQVGSVADLRAKREATLLAIGAAKKKCEELEQVVDEVTALDRQLAIIEPFARALIALHRHLGDAKFKKFATERKQDKLIAVATTILRRITNERYGFGPNLRIVDRTASQARSPETLSGGEKFLASLALALALVEIAKRSGQHFGALFLDEGFGSLDPRALDDALSELEFQAESGRMIGVITHVASVVEFIEDAFKLSLTPSGSDVARVGSSEAASLSVASAELD